MFATAIRASTSRIASFPAYVGASHTPAVASAPRIPLPLLPHPNPVSPPAHPPRPPLRPPPRGYIRTLHASPAAYPRDLRESTTGGLARASHPYRSTEPGKDEAKEERNARLNADKEECVRQRVTATEWGLEEAMGAPHPSLWVSAERWKRDTPHKDGVTLVCMHACGLNKEVRVMHCGLADL
jgi:hypothetical protein